MTQNGCTLLFNKWETGFLGFENFKSLNFKDETDPEEAHTNDQKHPKTSEGNHVINSEKIYPLSLPDKIISCSVMK